MQLPRDLAYCIVCTTVRTQDTISSTERVFCCSIDSIDPLSVVDLYSVIADFCEPVIARGENDFSTVKAVRAAAGLGE